MNSNDLTAQEYVKLRSIYSISDEVAAKYDEPSINPVEVGRGTTSAGFRVLVTGYATYADDCIVANIVGGRTSVYGVIASFHSNRITNALDVKTGYYSHTQLKTKSDQYKVFQTSMGEWNVINAFLASTRLINPSKNDKTTFVMANNLHELINNVYARLQTNLPFPIQRWWKDFIFREGRDEGAITKLAGDGVSVYRIDMDSQFWGDIISTGLKANYLAWTEAEHNEMLEAINISESGDTNEAA
jgi:hypothetical protein